MPVIKNISIVSFVIVAVRLAWAYLQSLPFVWSHNLVDNAHSLIMTIVRHVESNSFKLNPVFLIEDNFASMAWAPVHSHSLNCKSSKILKHLGSDCLEPEPLPEPTRWGLLISRNTRSTAICIIRDLNVIYYSLSLSLVSLTCLDFRIYGIYIAELVMWCFVFNSEIQ